jgi:parallel beta-helix repeat protein
MTRNAFILLTLLILLVAGAQFTNLSSANFFPDPGPDLPRIYIRSNGNVEPAMAPIERTGNIYKLTDNIVLYTIEIQRDNIVLDGAGHTIQGNGSWLGYDAGNNGVIVVGRNNVTITRLNIEQCYAGIRISSSSHINIAGNTFINGTTMGVAVQDSTLVLIEANDFTDIYGPSVSCNGSANTIRNNRLTGSVYGIKIEGSSNVISDNRIELLLPIILDKADSNIIARNNITGPASSPHLPDQNFKGNEGIALFVNCSNNMIFGNNITGFVNQAIRIVDGSNNTVYGNYMADNQFAIALGGLGNPVNNTFYGNTFTADSCNLLIDNANGAFWDNGTIGNYWGDYNGTDSNGDGIGDAPYIVNGFKWDNDIGGLVSFVFGQDNYPLMKPYDIEHDTVVLPQTEPFLAVLAAVAVAVVVGAGLLIYIKKYKRQAKT